MLGCTLALYRSLAAPPEAVLTAQPEVPTVPAVTAEPLFDVALLHASYPMGRPTRFTQTDLPFGPAAQVVRRPAAAAPQIAALSPPQPATPMAQAPVPLPAPRPVQTAAPDSAEPQAKKPQITALRVKPKIDDPFEKLFGRRESGPALAYAPSDGGAPGGGRSIPAMKMPPNDGLSAIYDITARTVYLPDGTKLEAHSGLGPKMDDPDHVDVKMHGATPPHVYDLVPREALFHGVAALRLLPVGGSEAIFGRTGLLTHTYLLGPRGDSNGCISFKDYDTFLQAYLSGKVRRMIVVASLDDPQISAETWERARTTTAPQRDPATAWAGERNGSSARWAQAAARDKAAAPFARVD